MIISNDNYVFDVSPPSNTMNLLFTHRLTWGAYDKACIAFSFSSAMRAAGRIRAGRAHPRFMRNRLSLSLSLRLPPSIPPQRARTKLIKHSYN